MPKGIKKQGSGLVARAQNNNSKKTLNDIIIERRLRANKEWKRRQVVAGIKKYKKAQAEAEENEKKLK